MNWSLLNWWTDDGWGCGPFITSASYFSVPLDTILSFDEPGSLAHMINGIFTYMHRCFFLMVNLGKYTSPMDPVYIYIYDPMGLKTYPSHTPGVHPKTRKLTLHRSLVFAPKMGAKLGEIPKTLSQVFSATGRTVKMAVDMFSTRWDPQKTVRSRV